MTNQEAAALRQFMARVQAVIANQQKQLDEVKALCASRPRSVTEEIDAIVGRRVFYTLSQTQSFDANDDGQRSDAMSMLVSQDGPFVMTHYPLVMWRPSAPSNTTNFGRWRPVTSWPLPDQVLDDDIIDISYEMSDSGAQRNFQNLPVAGGLLSRPDNMIPLPVPTLFSPNTVVQFTPTYENILFNSATPPTAGILVVALPGYRIVNL